MKTKDYHWGFVNEKFKSLSKALKLQAREYKRRLKDLNGEASRLRSIQENYVPREVYDRGADAHTERHNKDIKSLNDRIDRLIDDKIDPLLAWKTKQEGRSQLLQYVPWLIAIIAIIVSWYKK